MIASQANPPPPAGRQPCRNASESVTGYSLWVPMVRTEARCPSHGLSRTKWPSLPTAPVWPSPCALGPPESACAHTTRSWTNQGIGGNPVSGRRWETAAAWASPRWRGGRGSVNEYGFARLESGISQGQAVRERPTDAEHPVVAPSRPTQRPEPPQANESGSVNPLLCSHLPACSFQPRRRATRTDTPPLSFTCRSLR